MLIQPLMNERPQVLFRQHAIAREVRVGLNHCRKRLFARVHTDERGLYPESGLEVERFRAVRSVRIMRSGKRQSTVILWSRGDDGTG